MKGPDLINRVVLFKNPLLLFIIMAALATDCKPRPAADKHIFYLHGRIIEIQGINAVSEQFGPYQYSTIVDSLENTGAIVHAEVRSADTDFQQYCEKTSREIDQLVAGGVNPADITIIGASKGAMMAMLISHLNQNPVNYVLLGANSDYLEQTYDWNLRGNILGIYEKSDKIGGKDYQYWIDRSPDAVSFQQLQIDTGLGHGFLYNPIPQWFQPAMTWAESQKLPD